MMIYPENKVRLTELIAPSFYCLHRAVKSGKYTHYWEKGGRGSTKSSCISLEIVKGIMQNPGTHAVCLRKVGLYLKDSVYEQLLWAISALKVDNLWKEKSSPLELVYIPTGQRIIFRGADKPKKIKSTKVRSGYIRYIWYEEVDEFTGIEEIRTINQSLMRGGAKYDVFYSFNPPKAVRNWVNTEVTKTFPDRFIHHSDYRDVPAEWLGEQFLIEAEHLKQSNPSAYEHEYLGNVTGTGAEVFNNVSIRAISDEEISTFDRIYRGIDWGFAADPFVYNAMHYDSKRKILYVFYEFYKQGAKYEAIAKAIGKENKNGGIITAESAEPRSNSELRDRGFNVVAAKKGPGSVEHGITWLQNLSQIVIDNSRCPNTAREFLEYELEPDNNGGFREGFPDKNNHSIDAVRYALESVIGKKTAKVGTTRRGIY